MNILKSNNQLRKELKEKEKEIEILTQKVNGFKTACHSLLDKSTPEIVIGKLLDKNIRWFDYTKLEKDKQIEYYEEAQAILRSPAFKNEKNAYIKDLANYIATSSKDHNHTENLRYSINGVQTLWERFGKIRDPRTTPKESKDPHAPL